MKKASEYREHAQECRALAAKMESGEQRELLLKMAAQWDRMATDRTDLILRHPELAQEGEHEEEQRQARRESDARP